MENITTIGLEIAKHVLQMHAVNDAGAAIVPAASYAAMMSLDFSSHCHRA